MKSIAEIASELQGYDPQALSAEAVQAFLARLAEPVRDIENVGIFDALDRVLAQDLISPVSVPPHDNSAMDGFAFDGSQLSGSVPLGLEVVGTALAGKAWKGAVGPGQCVKIMTGAVMPAGLDTVVPQELASVRTETGASAKAGDCGHQRTMVCLAPNVLERGDNRRLCGEDLQQGKPALRQGTRLGPAACGLVASLGVAAVPVYRRLRVAYFSTGDEILSLGQAPREGAVYDSNRYTVFGLLKRLGCEVIDAGVVPDDPVALTSAFTSAASQADAIITSGGVSVGEADYTRAMMKKLGDVAFWRIAMRPGRPMAAGRIGSAVLFGLPGNPVAVVVTFLAFVRPALLRMMGSNSAPPPLLQARSEVAIRKKSGRTEYQRGLVSVAADGVPQVRIAGNQGSGVLSSVVHANGLLVLAHGQGNVAPGDMVSVMMFDGVI